MRNAEGFDNMAFEISPLEASAMDPQQRLMLESGYTALLNASLERSALMETVSGVYLGI